MGGNCSSRKTSVSYMHVCRSLKRTNPDEYIENLHRQIIEEFKNSGTSTGLSSILTSIAKNKSDEEDSQVALNVAYTFYEMSMSGRKSAKKAARELLLFLRNSADLGSSMEMEEDRNGAQATAEQIKSEAEAEAKRITSKAESEAERIMRDAEAEAERIRREAQDTLQSAKDSAIIQAERIYKDKEKGFVPHAVRELVDEYRRSDAEEYRASEEQRKDLLWSLEQEHAELCAQVKRLQANIISTLNNTQNDLCNYLTQWREAFYKKEVMGLAECYVALHKILNNLNTQFTEAAAAPSDGAASRQLGEQLDKILKNLNRFAKQFRNAMLGVGLDVYFPAEGERFDAAQHILEGSDGEDYMLEDREIADCRVPGVRMSQSGGPAKGFEYLIRAEITLKQEGSR